MAAGAFRKQRIFGTQFHAAGELVLWLPAAAYAHVAGRYSHHLAACAKQHLGGGKARIDLDPQAFRLGGEPAAHIAERDDEIAVIVHQGRHQRIGKAQRSAGAQHIETIVGDRRLDGRIFTPPIGQQEIEGGGIDHGAGHDVGADLGALFHDHDGNVGRELLQPDCGRKARGTGADHHHVELHRLPGGHLHHQSPSCSGSSRRRFSTFAGLPQSR